jgi:hypothetical protein
MSHHKKELAPFPLDENKIKVYFKNVLGRRVFFFFSFLIWAGIGPRVRDWQDPNTLGLVITP